MNFDNIDLKIYNIKIMDIRQIQERINREYCQETYNKLRDESLLPKYMSSPSVKKNLKNMIDGLKELNICKEELTNNDLKKKIIDSNKLRDLIIKPGTKGRIRGPEFENLTYNKIYEILNENPNLNLVFEKQQFCPGVDTGEKPDFIIKNRTKTIIGMIQVDFFDGGAQRNRADKYINSSINNLNCKLLSVMCNHHVLKNDGQKLQLFKKGFENNTLCYLNGLKKIIIDFFN